MDILNKIDLMLLEISFSPSKDFRIAELYPSDPYSCVIEYMTNGVKYRFETFDDGDESWNILFGPVDKNDQITTKSFQKSRKESKTSAQPKSWENATYSWGNLQKCLEYFLKKKKVSKFYFEGGDEDLQNLYTSPLFVRNIEKLFPAYKHIKLNSKEICFVRI